MEMTWANRITIFRFFLIPVFVYYLWRYEACGDAGYRWVAFWVYVGAALSDALDGFIARRFHQRSEFGAIMDPLADKALMLAALVMFSELFGGGVAEFYVIPMWFLGLVVVRDLLLVVGGVIVKLQRRTQQVEAHWTGKWSTFFQMMLITFILGGLGGMLVDVWLYVAGAFTVGSFFFYLVRTLRYQGGGESVEGKK